MASIAGVRGAVDWLSGAWANIQATSGSSSSTGIAILDALTGKSQPSDGLSISDGQNLAATFAVIQQNLVEQQGILAGQAALARVQKEYAAKFPSNGVNKVV